MEPEIARLCSSCGASVRGTARFCPQCGQTMAGAAGLTAAAQTTRQPALVEEAERVASSLSGRLAEHDAHERAGDADVSASRSEPTTRERADDEASSQIKVADNEATTQTQPADTVMTNDSVAATTVGEASAGDEATAGAARVRQRAAAVGAGLGESLRPRVGKLRERSVVVLDEAAEDPGLRFVLVAIALFVVALLLFIFSFALR